MTLELEWMRPLMTVMAFVTFIGIVLWAWSSSKQSDFEWAARSVLENDADDAVAAGDTQSIKAGFKHE